MRILVPVDGSETAERGLQEALKLAQLMKSKLHLLNVVDEYPLMVEMSSVVNALSTPPFQISNGRSVTS